MPITISVVVTAGESGDDLDATIRALYEQVHDEIEIVVLARPYVEIADHGPGVVVVRVDCVDALCRYRAVQLAAGEVVAFLKAGVIPTRTWARQLLMSYEQPDVGAVGGAVSSGLGMGSVKRQSVSARADSRVSEIDPPYDLYCDAAADPLLLLDEGNFSARRSALRQVVGSQGTCAPVSAAELGRRLVENGFRLAVAADAVIRDDRPGLVPSAEACPVECAVAEMPPQHQQRLFVPLSLALRARRHPRFVIGPTPSVYEGLPAEWLSGLHVLVPGSSDLDVSSLEGSGHGVAWLHRVPSLAPGVCAVPSSPEITTVGIEAGLLRELLRMRAADDGGSIDDLRPPGGWPFMELLSTDFAERRRRIAELVDKELGCGGETATAVAAELLDADLYPVSLPGLLRRTLRHTDSEFVRILFQSLVDRPPTADEQAFFTKEAALPGGRTRSVRNLASSSQGPQHRGAGNWVETLDQEIEAARLERLPATLALSSEEFVREAYSAILRRPADAPGMEHFELIARDTDSRLKVLEALTTSAEAQSKGVDMARALRGVGFYPRRRGRFVLGAHRLWRLRPTTRSDR